MAENMGYLCLQGMAEGSFALRIREGQQLLVLSADVDTRVRRGGCTFLMAPGQAMILSAGDKFDLQLNGAGRRYLVSFTDEVLKNGLFELNIMPDLLLRELGPRAVEPNQRPGLSLYIEELISRSSGEAGTRIAACYNTIILLLIVETFYKPSIQERSNGLGGQYEAIIKRYISDNLAGDLSLEELASCAGISKRQVYNLFNNLFGMTPGEYIRRARLMAVHREISNCMTRENITDIALKYGFSNPGRFSQQYKAYVGELPSQTLKKRLRGGRLHHH
ncbi:helix-turn-helix domain-containing protein [Marinobacterium zhoushanense]|nr:helix-turn-helix domain-containing protein [Marinobacterium zhoushanense]